MKIFFLKIMNWFKVNIRLLLLLLIIIVSIIAYNTFKYTDNIGIIIFISLVWVSLVITYIEDYIFPESYKKKINNALIYVIVPSVFSIIIKYNPNIFKSGDDKKFFDVLWNAFNKINVEGNLIVILYFVSVFFLFGFPIILKGLKKLLKKLLEKLPEKISEQIFVIDKNKDKNKIEEVLTYVYLNFLLILLYFLALLILLANINDVVNSDNIDIILFYYATVVLTMEIFVRINNSMKSLIIDKKKINLENNIVKVENNKK